MIVHRFEKPRAIRGKYITRLPVHWLANRKAWVTSRMFLDWFENCFTPEVERYLRRKNLDNKALLVIDNAPDHPQQPLATANPNIKVVFLPPNTTFLIQPLDQGALNTFKENYLKRSLNQIVEKIDNNPDLTVKEVWKAFSVADAISIIKEACDDMKQSTLNSAWKNIWPEVVTSSPNPQPQPQPTIEILQIARRIPGEGFVDLTEEDIEDLVKSHSEELSEKDLEEIINSHDESDEEDENTPIEKKPLTLAKVRLILEHANNLMEEVEEDPCTERTSRFKADFRAILAPYEELKKDLVKKAHQPTLYSFFKPAEQQPLEPQPSTSGYSSKLNIIPSSVSDSEESDY